MKNKLFMVLIVLISITNVCKAQDLIYKKDNKVLKTVIIEIGSDEIRYKEFSNQNVNVLSIKKSDVVKIRTASGKEILLEQGSSYSLDNKHAFKVDLISWSTTKLTFAFEKSLKPGKSREYQIGFIGIGAKLKDVETVGGLFFRYGIKFIRSPEKYIKEGNEAHLLKGSYIRPEITFGIFDERGKNIEEWYNPNTKTHYTITNKYHRSVAYGAIMLNVGKQWVMDDDYLIDFFWGMGLGMASKDDTEMKGINYSMVGSNPIYFQLGLKVGMLYK